MVAEALTDGCLLHLLPGWALLADGIHAVLPAQRFRPSRVSAFVALLARAERARQG